MVAVSWNCQVITTSTVPSLLASQEARGHHVLIMEVGRLPRNVVIVAVAVTTRRKIRRLCSRRNQQVSLHYDTERLLHRNDVELLHPATRYAAEFYADSPGHTAVNCVYVYMHVLCILLQSSTQIVLDTRPLTVCMYICMCCVYCCRVLRR